LIAVSGEHGAFSVGACVRFYYYALIKGYLVLQQVGDVFFIVDFSAAFQGVKGVAGNVNRFGDGNSFRPEVQQRSELAVAGEFDLAAVYGFFAEHFHEVACLESAVFALRPVQHHGSVLDRLGVVFTSGFGGEPVFAYGESDFTERDESQIYPHLLSSEFYARFVGF
jgi:hypothetical protein